MVSKQKMIDGLSSGGQVQRQPQNDNYYKSPHSRFYPNHYFKPTDRGETRRQKVVAKGGFVGYASTFYLRVSRLISRRGRGAFGYSQRNHARGF